MIISDLDDRRDAHLDGYCQTIGCAASTAGGSSVGKLRDGAAELENLDL
jgi:hypothetical protein